MKAKSVFGKFLVSLMLVFGLVAFSCNTNQRSREVQTKERNDGSEEVRIKERQDNDSIEYRRDQTIERDEDGNTEVRNKTRVETDRNNQRDQDNL
jgi:hypothetical protein